MIYRFTLNNTVLTDEPNGWENAETVIEEDDAIRGLFFEYLVDVEFGGDGYAEILDQFTSSTGVGTTGQLTCLIESKCTDGDAWSTFFDGIIFMDEVSFDYDRCIASVDLQDNRGSARIMRNKKQKALIDVGTSLNGVSITACSTTTFTLFDVNTGGYTQPNRDGFAVYDIFEFLIAYMTDGEIGFQSTFFSDTSANQGGLAYLFKGSEIRSAAATNNTLDLSFEELFEEMNKIYGIGFAFVDNGGSKVVRIEKKEFFVPTTGDLTLNQTNELTLQTYDRDMYSSVVVGSEDNNTGTFPEDRFVGWNEENYNIAEYVQRDEELNLVNEYIIHSNIIDDILSGSTSYEFDKVFVECDPSSNQAVSYDTVQSGTNANYNETANNNNKIIAHFTGVPNSIVKHLATGGTSEFLAKATNDDKNTATITTALVTPVTSSCAANWRALRFDDDYSGGNDAGNNYGNGTVQGNPVAQIDSLYTIPASGTYLFETLVKLQTSGVWTGIDVAIDHYDSTGACINSYNFGGFSMAFLTNPTKDVLVQTGFYAKINDFVIVTYKGTKTSGSLTALTGSYFKTLSVPDDGGVYKSPDATPIDKQYNFNATMSKTDYDNISATPYGLVTFTHLGTTRTGWVRKLAYKVKDGTTQINLKAE